MRILIISNLFPTPEVPHGGIFISNRIRALRARGHIVNAVALEISRSPRRAVYPKIHFQEPSQMGGAFHRLAIPLSMLFRAELKFGRFDSVVERASQVIANWAKDRDFDVVHAHGMYLVPAGAVARKVAHALGVKCFITCHGSDVAIHMARNAKRYSDILSGAAGVAFPSVGLLERASHLGMAVRNTTVIPNGVDLRTFNPRPQGTSDPTPQILFVGSLHWVKGADRLPQLFRGISECHAGARFRVVGAGPLGPKIKRLTSGLRVDFSGNLPPRGVAEAMRESSLLLMPSRSEGFGCVALEAHACGVPVVAAGVGGLPESIGDPRFIVADDHRLLANFTSVCRQVLLGEIAVDREALVSRSLAYDWSVIAERELSLLGGGPAGD